MMTDRDHVRVVETRVPSRRGLDPAAYRRDALEAGAQRCDDGLAAVDDVTAWLTAVAAPGPVTVAAQAALGQLEEVQAWLLNQARRS